jgi:branched-chain amino acid transport system substrate-binding protein
MVTDYGPGHDSEAAFQRAFKERRRNRGLGALPVANPDFSAFVQRAKDMNLECIYIFIPGGAQPAALERRWPSGHRSHQDQDPGIGRGHVGAGVEKHGRRRLGIISAWHYDYKSDAPRNVEFVKLFNEMHGRNPDFFSIGGYDGMHAIYEALKRAGRQDRRRVLDHGRQGNDVG